MFGGVIPNSTRYRTTNTLGEQYFRPEDFDVVEREEEVAKEKSVPAAQLVLSWLLHKGITTPIIGATRIEHVEDAVNAVELNLSQDDIKRIEEP